MSISRLRWRLASALIAAGATAAAAFGLAVPAGASTGTTKISMAGATTAPQALGPPEYTENWAGYSVGGGRLFRFISTTLTVPAAADGAAAVIGLSHGQPVGQPFAELEVDQGGGTGSVRAHVSPGDHGTLPLSPRAGDQLAVSIYYDQHGHDYFTASDATQHITRTIRLTAGSVLYNHGFVISPGGWPNYPPQADTRLLQFTGSKVTTYTGVHDTLTGPWATWQYITTTTGTAAGTVKASPTVLSNNGQNFGVWLRALPLAYTHAFAGYADSGGPFRYIATSLTVPAAQDPAANGGSVQVSLAHNGGPTPRPNANIGILPGGGAGSISYSTNAALGTFTLSPNVGDQLTVSIYYDRHSHYQFTATDLTHNTTQTVTVNALYADQMPLNSAELAGVLNNDTAVSPPSDVQLWDFTGTRVTSYSGTHGSILGPWATGEEIDTTAGTSAGTVVMNASVLSDYGQNFGVWLRHR